MSELEKYPDDYCPICTHMVSNIISINIGGMWEGQEWEIILNKSISSLSSSNLCPHCRDHHIHIHTRSHDKQTWEEEVWICDKVVVGKNEGGFCSTGICLDCIIHTAQVEGL